MKTLYLNRHAKSSWDDPSLADFDRPLNKRGKRDAPFMGEVLSKLVPAPDVIYSSPANRALTTAKIIGNAFDYREADIIEDINIYESAVSELLRIVNSTSNEHNSIMMFGHNPTFTMASNFLSDKFIDNIPTCGFVQIDFDVDSWELVEGDRGKLVLFEYPKKHLQ